MLISSVRCLFLRICLIELVLNLYVLICMLYLGCVLYQYGIICPVLLIRGFIIEEIIHLFEEFWKYWVIAISIGAFLLILFDFQSQNEFNIMIMQTSGWAILLSSDTSSQCYLLLLFYISIKGIMNFMIDFIWICLGLLV